MIKPWYNVVTPREDLRDGKPLDAAEFAVHLDRVRDGTAPPDYLNPERFFDRTFMTKNIINLGSEVIRRLNGTVIETSAVFSMTTQFGGGKTHALTMLYHLANHGPESLAWHGVRTLLDKSGMRTVPNASIAVFVGTEFDSIKGRGGNDGTPLRKTPWGELAYQLGGDASFHHVREHDQQWIAPAGDVIRDLIPDDKPALILMDEIMNYVSRNRKSGLSEQLYDFLHNLSETVRGMNNVVLVISLPKSEIIEMTSDDESDYDRLKHMLNRLGKPLILASESEVSEIIRRRLFEWEPAQYDHTGKVNLSRDAIACCNEYSEWVLQYRNQIPNWFPIDQSKDVFRNSYPFHPSVLSVFERKWQTLPRFQQTRGILKLLALWVSISYRQGYEGGHRDPLVDLGSAPLDDPMFRAAMFEQLGQDKLESAVTTDISGKAESFAVRLDKESIDSIKKSRLHKKAATAILFESNGGVIRNEATIPEIRLAVGNPNLDIGNIDTVLEALSTSCYFLIVDKNKYRFSIAPNLNKILADRRASIQKEQIDECVKSEIENIISSGPAIDKVFFPERSNQIQDRAALTLIILPPEKSIQNNQNILKWIEMMTREYGSSGRTYKSALIWIVPESSRKMTEDARTLLAWDTIEDEATGLGVDETQKRLIPENRRKAERDLKESIWRSYKNIILLNKNNEFAMIDLGSPNSSAADTFIGMILNRLKQSGDLESDIHPNYLTRNWPPAFTEWNTRSVRDAFYASPLFPRLMNPESIKGTIARGVSLGLMACVTKDGSAYDTFIYKENVTAADIDISGDVYLIRKDVAEAVAASRGAATEPSAISLAITEENAVLPESGLTVPDPPVVKTEEPKLQVQKIAWTGELPPQKWMQFYTKVLSRFVSGHKMTVSLTVEISSDSGISSQKIDDAKVALGELGLRRDIKMT